MRQRGLVVHGHFYQPPRENPWTETVPVEPSAAPAHDWNERIAEECYRPNTAARIVDDHGLVLGIVNNFEHLSFNLGPTLAAWLEAHRPAVYRAVVDADAKAGTAIAQAYHHSILPLCSPRDLRTQIRWGIADFEHRFGRAPAGMWLPECAVNDDVLAALAEEGIAFTILAPGQAAQAVDPTVPYRWDHPDGERSVTIVFYDGGLSHDVAFGMATVHASVLVDRAEHAIGHGAGRFVCVATDGETFGHHHHFAERAIAYALGVEAPRRTLATGALAAMLGETPPVDVVKVHESAWSCAHGVGRWSTDCGCHTGGQPGWTQRWRAPLRAALDLLRDHAATVFAERGQSVFVDAWSARDDYVGVLLGRVSTDDFASRHLRRGADLVEALTLLESQRHAMAMYTSCGWFFNDLAGIETAIVLRYAARCIDLLRELGDEPPETHFLEVLATAQSNVPEEGDGRAVWERHVVPARVGAERVVAHLALAQLLEGRDPEGTVGGFDVVPDRTLRAGRGGLDVVAARFTLVHRRTRRRSTAVVAAMSFGALEVAGATRAAGRAATDDLLMDGLIGAVGEGERVASLLRRVAEGFGPKEFGLESVLPDAAGEILSSTARNLTDRFAASFERLVRDNHDTLSALAVARYPLPAEVRVPAQFVLARRLEADLEVLSLGWDRLAARAARQTVDEAQALAVRLDTAGVAAAATAAVTALTAMAVQARSPEALDAVRQTISIARTAGVPVRLAEAQEIAYAAAHRTGVDGDARLLRELGWLLGLAG